MSNEVTYQPLMHNTSSAYDCALNASHNLKKSYHYGFSIE